MPVGVRCASNLLMVCARGMSTLMRIFFTKVEGEFRMWNLEFRMTGGRCAGDMVWGEGLGGVEVGEMGVGSAAGAECKWLLETWLEAELEGDLEVAKRCERRLPLLVGGIFGTKSLPNFILTYFVRGGKRKFWVLLSGGYLP